MRFNRVAVSRGIQVDGRVGGDPRRSDVGEDRGFARRRLRREGRDYLNAIPHVRWV
jgi:hypothetical protein